MKTLRISLVFAALFALVSCGKDATPKPRGYFRIDLGKADYKTLDSPCGFGLEVNKLSYIEQAASKGGDRCWFNIVYPRHKARLHFTYSPLSGNLAQLSDEAYRLAFEHEVKATAIKRSPIEDSVNDLHGLVYDLKGHVASPIQFYVTDSTKHFLRAALYFEHRPNPDSLAPVQAWIREDVEHLLETLRWNHE